RLARTALCSAGSRPGRLLRAEPFLTRPSRGDAPPVVVPLSEEERMQERADTVAAVDPAALETEALSAIASAPDADALDAARVRWLGRKSALKLALREVRDRETGMALNAVREHLEA